MIKIIKSSLIAFLLICAFAVSSSNAYSQQVIINVPSSEVLPMGDIILKESNRFSPFEDGGYARITPSFTMGVGRGAEISLGVGATFNQTTMARGDISAKKVWFLGSSTRLTAGGTVSPYLSQHFQPDTFMYAHLSQRIRHTKTSLTAGGYIHGNKSFPDKAGVLVGMDQVIIPNKLRLAVDWLSTENSVGRFGVGLKYRPVPTVSVTSSVIVPNRDDERLAFNVSVSKFISIKDIITSKRRL